MIKDFFAGLSSYGKAFSTIRKMRLWKFVFLPGLVSVLLASIIGATAWGLSDNLGRWLISWYPFSFGNEWLGSISAWVGGALILVLGLIIYKHLVMVLASPFMSPLSEKIEERMTGQTKPYKGFEGSEAIKDLVRGLRIALRNIIREMLFVLPLFLLSFIPAVGIIATVLIFIIQAYYAGFGNMDYTLERHFSVKGSVRFVKDNRGLAIGNGTIFMLLLMTGIGFLIAPPLAAVAATLETVPRLPNDSVDIPQDYV